MSRLQGILQNCILGSRKKESLSSLVKQSLSNSTTRTNIFLPTGIGSKNLSTLHSSKNDAFKNYRYKSSYVVTPGKLSAKRTVPDTIQTPDYYRTGYVAPLNLIEPEIKSEEQIKKLRDACSLARNVLNKVMREAKAGVTTDDLDLFCHELIISHGAYPSPLNYKGFPKSICTSVNNCACHGIPDDRQLQEGDIVNIDVTVYYNGYHGDCSETVIIGDVDERGKKLVEAAKKCMEEGIFVCGPNVPFNLIGMAIEAKADELNFSVVPAFAGHGIGQYFHGPPDIFHFDHDSPGVMKSGMTFTVEPVISEGGPDIKILKDGWTAITTDNARTAQFEHTVLVTPTGVELLTK